MKLVFVDETENSNILGSFYGVCAVVVDAVNYTSLRSDVEAALTSVGWCTDEEFKGTSLFSSTSGDKTVSVPQRIAAAEQIIAATMSLQNARCRCVFAWNTLGNGDANHLALCEQAIHHALPKAPGQQRDKNIAAVFLDEKQSITRQTLSPVVDRAVHSRGYVLLEDAVIVKSSCRQPGIIVADLVAYLSMWVYSGHLAGQEQLSFFGPGSGKVPKHMLEKLSAVESVMEGGSGVKFRPRLP